jgi:arylsulfatase A-like enzyme
MKPTHLLAIFFALLASSASAATRPNVLFLAVDDMNDWIGCLNSTPRAITPNFNRLAARGVNFTNAHTAGVFCAPSRAAVFSGQFASSTGCYSTATYFVDHPEIEPLQLSFSKSGYETFGAGKLFHHPAGMIDQRGWTEFFLRNPAQRENGWPLESWGEDSPFPTPFPNSIYNQGQAISGGLFLEWAAIPDDREEDMADTIRINWAVEKLKQSHDKPFFLGVGIYAPHFPNYCPQKYFDLYNPDEIEFPPYKHDDLDDLPAKIRKMKTARSRIHQKLEALGAVKDAIHGYLACISYADAMMGRVLDALEESPYADNTIVVLWSDHGYHHGEKGDWGKHTLWERTSNVPFIWAGPGVAKGKGTDVTVSLIDIYPTLVDLCGLPEPHQKLEGESLAETLETPDTAHDRSVLLPHMNPGEYAVINRDWRYIRYGEDGEELYDLKADPNEWTNLATLPQFQTIKQKMRAFAPAHFAPPGTRLKPQPDLRIEGDSFRWTPGQGNAGAHPAYLPPITSTPKEPGGVNLIRNGSFEHAFDSESGWKFRAGAYEITPRRHCDGKHALMSAKHFERERAVKQTIAIAPTHLFEARFNVFFEPGSRGKVVFDTSDQFDETAQIVMDASTTGRWLPIRCFFNSGQHDEVTLRFFPGTDFSGRFFIDDVQLFDTTSPE